MPKHKKTIIMKTRVRVAMKLTSLSAQGKTIKAQSIKDAMQSSGNFPATSMPVSYGALQTLITNLHNAVVAADNGTTTDTSYMHEQERILISAFNFIKAYVEMEANNATDPATIITSAGMQVAVNGGQNAVNELTLDAIGGGTLQIRIPRLTDEKAFVFESSTDGTSWTEAIVTTLTKTELKSLAPGSTVYIRYYAISKTGKSVYSTVKNAIIIIIVIFIIRYTVFIRIF